MTAHGSVTIVYDGDGNRVSETAGGVTTKYLVDDRNSTGLPQVLDEKVSGSVTRTYAYGLMRISENQLVSGTWKPSFYGYDGHGNVRLLANTAGTVTDTYQYDAFGMPIASSGTTTNNFRYSGERLDSSIGLYDLRARYYNQATGRFWARDPVEGEKCCGLSWNPYIYTRDNPVNQIDPTGREVFEEYEEEDFERTKATFNVLRLERQLAYAQCVYGVLVYFFESGAFDAPDGNLLYILALEQAQIRCAPLLEGWPPPGGF